MADIDPMDARILQALESDGRLTNAALAEKVGLSASATLRRVQALERAGVITGFRAQIDRGKLGRGFAAYVAVGLSSHTREAQWSFEYAMAAAPEVIECHNITGTIEYLLRIEVADLAAYKRFHTDGLGTHPQVTSITSYVVMASPKDLRA
ncbi:MAG: Lrp/AsnC family transcriptional regulator [Pseudomonadota bacterium]